MTYFSIAKGHLMLNITRSLDLFTMAFVFGATLWFFFVQSPVLLKKMGRDKFVPLQMRLTIVLFKSLCVALLLMLGAALLASEALLSWSVLTAAVALMAAAINKLLILPRALRAGGRSMNEARSAQTSLSSFASEGAGDAARFWHRTVVLFVVLMLAGLIAHAIALVSV